jgi:hypothetical protein
MDLRKEIHDIIEETGHHVLLQRSSRWLRCSCWNEKYQEAEAGCSLCLGKGKVTRIERHKVRDQLATNIITLPEHIQRTAIGRIATDTRVIFMKHDTHPKIGDIIMEVGWNGQRPTHIIHQYEINYADPLREKKGRIEFYQVTAKEISVDTGVRGFAVRRMGPVKNYEKVLKG